MSRNEERESIYGEVAARVIAELEQRKMPWGGPWNPAKCGCAMTVNAATGRRYSGINILILWAAVIKQGYAGQHWLTYLLASAPQKVVS